LSKTSTVTINLNDVVELVDPETDNSIQPADENGPDETTDNDDTKNEAPSYASKTVPTREDDLLDAYKNEETETEQPVGDTEDDDSGNYLAGVPNVAVDMRANNGASDGTDQRGKSSRDRDTGRESGGATKFGVEKEQTALKALSAEGMALGLAQKGTERMSVQARKMLSDTRLQNQLNALKAQISEAADKQDSEAKYVVGTAGGMTASFVAGFALWVLRGVSLIASAMASLPVWGNFDPMPVLSRWEKDPPSGQSTDETSTDDDESRLKKIFEDDQASVKRKGKR
jgi:hypothetical protein